MSSVSTSGRSNLEAHLVEDMDGNVAHGLVGGVQFADQRASSGMVTSYPQPANTRHRQRQSALMFGQRLLQHLLDLVGLLADLRPLLRRAGPEPHQHGRHPALAAPDIHDTSFALGGRLRRGQRLPQPRRFVLSSYYDQITHKATIAFMRNNAPLYHASDRLPSFCACLLVHSVAPGACERWRREVFEEVHTMVHVSEQLESMGPMAGDRRRAALYSLRHL